MIEPNPKIFREYDIRGHAESDLADGVVDAIGRAFAAMLKTRGGRSVSLGRDVRLSSPRISATIQNALTSSGLEVLDVGTVPTPLLYYSLFKLPVDGGIMVTGSHNPPDDNGIKLAIGKDTLYGRDIQEIREKIRSGRPSNGQPGKKGKVVSSPIRDLYIREISDRIGALSPFRGKPIRIVLDCGNGTAGLVAGDLFRSVGAEIKVLFENPDGHFPNHHPDPTVPENLKALVSGVREFGADVGIAFDGDTDRIGVVTEKGEILYGDQLMIVFANQVLSECPGSIVISEVKASKVLYDEIGRLGGKPLMWKAGHSLIKAKMKETGAPLAGEMSGHIFFADRYYGYDDALYAGLRLLEVMIKAQSPISDLLAQIPRTYSTPEIRKDCPDAIKFRVVEAMKPLLTERGIPFIDLDGIRVEYPDGWGLVRASNTQPALVLRFEGLTAARMEQIQKDLLDILSKAEALMLRSPG